MIISHNITKNYRRNVLYENHSKTNENLYISNFAFADDSSNLQHRMGSRDKKPKA